MTLKQLNSISNERKRLAKAFTNLLASRNVLIDSFQSEYERHKKLTAKKEDPKSALINSLSKSRKLKKIQAEFLDIKTRIKENQLEAKKLKKSYQESKNQYEIGLEISKKIKRELV